MDFITSFPRKSKQHDSITIGVDKTIKVAHFISVKHMNSSNEIDQHFIRDIMILHGVPNNILSEKDAKFTSTFWKELFVGLGTKSNFSTTYHL